MNKFILFSILPLFFIPYSVYGLTNLENTEIIAESPYFGNDFVLDLQFGENQFMNGKMVPTIDSGTLYLFDDFIELKNVRAKIMGNSFVVKSDDLLVYARGLGNLEYKINAYLITTHGFTKYELEATSESTTNFIPEKEQEENIDLHLLIEQDSKIYPDDTYSITIKAFDKIVNSEPHFDDVSGYLNDVNISVVLTHDKNLEEQFTLSGKTNDLGYWNGLLYFPEHNILFGTYLVDVTANYLGDIVTFHDEIFLLNAEDYGRGDITDKPSIGKGETIPQSPIIDEDITWNKYQDLIRLDGSHLYDPQGSYEKYSWIQVNENGDILLEDHPDYTGIRNSDESVASFKKPVESKKLYYQLTFTTSRDLQIVMYEVIFIK